MTEEVGLTQRCAVRRTGDRMHTRLQMQQEVSPAYRQRKLGTSPVDGIGAVWLDAGAVLAEAQRAGKQSRAAQARALGLGVNDVAARVVGM